MPTDYEAILAQFDFNGTGNAGDFIVPLPQAPSPGYHDAVAKIEDASAKGDLAAVEKHFTALRNERMMVGDALFSAVKNQHKAVVTYLLSEGVRVTPHVAYATTCNKAVDMLELFLEHRWDINEQLQWDIPPPLAFADDESTATWFLSHGADPNAPCELDITPLSFATQNSPLSVIKLLFDNGGSIQAGQLLHSAARRVLDDRLEVLTYILSKGPPVNDILYQKRPNSYYRRKFFGLGTPLHDAADVGNLDVARLLVANGANPLIRDSLGQTPLDRAERQSHPAMSQFLREVAKSAVPPLYQFTEGRCAQDEFR